MNILNPFLMSIMSLWPITLILVFWSALSVYIFIKAPAKYYLRFTLIPTLLASAILCVGLLIMSLGYAVSMNPPTEFEYLGHKVVLDGSYRKVGIEIWVSGKHTRLYVIKYSKKDEEKLKEAQEKKKSGSPVIMKRKPKASKETQGTNEGIELDEYESNIMLPHEVNPKIQESKPQEETPKEVPSENSRNNMI